MRTVATESSDTVEKMKDKEDILTPDVRFHLIKKMERHKVIAIAGTELLPHEAKYLEFHRVAGVILFERGNGVLVIQLRFGQFLFDQLP